MGEKFLLVFLFVALPWQKISFAGAILPDDLPRAYSMETHGGSGFPFGYGAGDPSRLLLAEAYPGGYFASFPDISMSLQIKGASSCGKDCTLLALGTRQFLRIDQPDTPQLKIEFFNDMGTRRFEAPLIRFWFAPPGYAQRYMTAGQCFLMTLYLPYIPRVSGVAQDEKFLLSTSILDENFYSDRNCSESTNTVTIRSGQNLTYVYYKGQQGSPTFSATSVSNHFAPTSQVWSIKAAK